MNPNLVDSVVVLGKKLVVIERDLTKEDVDGHYLADKGVIEIDINLDSIKKQEILGHEMFHAFLDLSGWSNYLHPSVEESLCQLFERIVMVIKQPFYKKEKK